MLAPSCGTTGMPSDGIEDPPPDVPCFRSALSGESGQEKDFCLPSSSTASGGLRKASRAVAGVLANTRQEAGAGRLLDQRPCRLGEKALSGSARLNDMQGGRLLGVEALSVRSEWAFVVVVEDRSVLRAEAAPVAVRDTTVWPGTGTTKD